LPTAILLKTKAWYSLTMEITVTIPEVLATQARGSGVSAEAYIERLLHRIALAAEERSRKQEALRNELLADWEHYQATGLHLEVDEVDGWLAQLAAGEDVEPPVLHV
jgi:hypothetical protein